MKRLQGLPLVADFILFIALCGSTAYWGLQLFKPQMRTIAAPPLAAPAAPNIAAAAGLFGGRPAGTVVASNYQLKGVIAAGPDGVAILAVDSKPPQAVGVNMEVAPGVTVKEVHPQYVLLDEGGMVKRVDLPESAKAGLVLASLSPAGSSGAPMPTSVPVPVPIPMPMPAPIMNVNYGQVPNQQSTVRRPSGIGPAVFGARPTQMPAQLPATMPPPAPQPVGLNEAQMQNPMRDGGHPGSQK